MSTVNSFGTRKDLEAAGRRYQIYSLPALQAAGSRSRPPAVLAEDPARESAAARGRRFVKAADIEALATWDVEEHARSGRFPSCRRASCCRTSPACRAWSISAAMRDGIVRLGGDPNRVNPLQPVELVIDHSVQVDYFGQAERVRAERRARVLAQQGALRVPALGTERVPQLPRRAARHRHRPPGESRVPRPGRDDGGRCRTARWRIPDTLVGTDSHTTMVNGLGVVGWGVGGIEAEAAMLGQPISMLIPPVLGVRLVGRLPEGTTATDLVLTITERLRKHGVVGKFVEFYGPGLAAPDDGRPRDARPTCVRNTARRSRSSRSTR